MTLRLPSLALLAALSAAASAQTTPATTPKATTPHHTTTAKTAGPASTIPKVAGIPKSLYALKYIDIKIGTGPLAESTVLGSSPDDSKIMQYTVRYTGWFPNGTKFDSSYDHPGAEPFPFPVGLHKVILGWDSGFQGMHVGGKRRIFVPWQLAYGESGRPPAIPAKSNLVFDIELVSQDDITSQFVRKPAPPPPSTSEPSDAPPAGSAPPANQPATPPTPPQPQTPPHPQTF
jgi:peptidylprolyl isomerase